jgi:hypothetical protein
VRADEASVFFPLAGHEENHQATHAERGKDDPGQDGKSMTRRLFHPCPWQRELALDLAAVKAIVELYVVPAADAQVAGNVVMQMTARKVHAAQVRTVRENAGQARA